MDHYGMLEEFITMVTELVPELMSYSQRAQLIMGLRAKVSDNLALWFWSSRSSGRDGVVDFTAVIAILNGKSHGIIGS